MSLERIIAEQQEKIDQLNIGNKKLIERSANVFKRNEELFEAWARLLDAEPADRDGDPAKWESYRALKHEVRMQMLDAGYCLRCYNFICECEDQYE